MQHWPPAEEGDRGEGVLADEPAIEAPLLIALCPKEGKPSAPLAKEKTPEWEPRDPWTLGHRTAVYKLGLLLPTSS